jgi:uncharacterized protein (TIGR02680 family)
MTVTALRPESEADGGPQGPGRWRPTRAGILNVWRYYDETFDFHRGRLLLRGPNGTGKSKVLELLLPYLLDASLRPSRLSTFGGAERTMHWNLIGHGWEGTTRVGYVWIEFHRVEADQDHWFTCGARLQATAHTRGVTPTYFVTSRRVGIPGGVPLVNDAGRPLTRADLIAAVGESSVFESPAAYRRAVRQALFRGFTEEKYEALITALLQLRIPKLSEHLNPEELSRILSQALPRLDHQDVAEVAEGFEKLDRRKETLKQLAAELEHSRLLANRQRTYARRVLRATAGELISATTRMDDATRQLRERRAELESVTAAERRLEDEDQRLAVEAHTVEQQISGLRDSDAYKEGQQLAVLRHEARQAASRAEAAQTAARQRAREADDDDQAAAEEATAAHRMAAATERAEAEARTAAVRVGLDGSVDEASAAESPERARLLLRSAVQARQEQVERVRVALLAHADAIRRRDEAEVRLQQRNEKLEEARAEQQRRAKTHEATLARLREDLHAWAHGCQMLPLVQQLDELLALAEDEPALLELVNAAAEPVRDELASHEARLAARQAALDGQRATHATELANLEGKRLVAPEPPSTRTADRSGLPGAPLWQLVDWLMSVDETTQARIEAALEASGLLDAWVLPDGAVRVAGHDTFADADLAVPSPGRSLADLLTVEPDSAIPADRVRALLAGIAVDSHAPDHPAAVGMDGSWRLGTARGTWDKPEARFIGAAARERNRQRRMAELRGLIESLDIELAEVTRGLADLKRRRMALIEEQRRRPPHDQLAEATRRLALTTDAVATRSDAVAEAEGEVRGAEDGVRQALRNLTVAAADSALPASADGLKAVAEALRALRALADTWMDFAIKEELQASIAAKATATANRSRQQADRDGEQADRYSTEAAGYQAKLNLVEQAVAAEYRETLAALEQLEHSLSACRARREEITTERVRLGKLSGELRGKLSGDEEASQAATGRRDVAAADFRGLRDTGFIADAGLRASLGDLDGTRAALLAARQVAEELTTVPYEPRLIKEVEARLAQAIHDVQQALAGHADLALEPDANGRLVLTATVDGLRMGASELHQNLLEEHRRAEAELTAYEEELFDEILTGAARRQVADRIRLADQLVTGMNDQLQQVTTASSMRVRLRWQVDPNLPTGTREARDLLLRDPASLPEADRLALHQFFRARIEQVRGANTAAGWEQQLLQMLDYTAWHQFVVQTDKDDGHGWVELTRRRHAALSGGEKAIVLHLPLFAAAATHYRTAPEAPRVILLDEVFVGVDSDNRGQLLRLLVDFDLDLVLTSDHEWCTYVELDGIAIHQLITGSDDDAVTTARFVWNGTRVIADDPVASSPDGPDGDSRKLFDGT